MPELHIGGFDFVVHCRQPLAPFLPGIPYANFLKPSGILDETPVEVFLSPMESRNHPPLQPLFEGPTWSMFSDGDLRRIVMRDREGECPLWMAEFRLNGRRADIFYGSRQIGTAGEVISPLAYPLDQLLIMYLLAESGGVLMHAAGGVRKGGVIYAGPSGAGKTTMTRMLLAEKCEMFSDDRVIVRPHDGAYLLFGTPWPGDAKVAVNRCTKLEQIYVLRKSDADRDEPLDPAAALAKIIPCCSLPWFDEQVLAQSLDGLSRMLKTIPHSVCHFTKKPADG
ncbi:MAG: hypothetical protein AB7T27_11915 [Kiritimatiellia bacterium]